MTQIFDEFDAGTSKPVLNMIIVLDISLSMKGVKINQLNRAIPEVVAVAVKIAKEEGIVLCLRIIAFSDEARWIVGNREKGVDRLDSFEPLTVEGLTNTAAAIDLVRTIFDPEILGERALKTVIMLIGDGESNERDETHAAFERLKEEGNNKMIRIALGVEGANEEELKDFASTGKIVRSDGTVEENAPFVFHCTDISVFRGLLMSLVVSSIISQKIDHAHDDDTPTLFLDAEPEGPDWDDFSM